MSLARVCQQTGKQIDMHEEARKLKHKLKARRRMSIMAIQRKEGSSASKHPYKAQGPMSDSRVLSTEIALDKDLVGENYAGSY